MARMSLMELLDRDYPVVAGDKKPKPTKDNSTKEKPAKTDKDTKDKAARAMKEGDEEWWDELSTPQQAKYIREHPTSQYAKRHLKFHLPEGGSHQGMHDFHNRHAQHHFNMSHRAATRAAGGDSGMTQQSDQHFQLMMKHHALAKKHAQKHNEDLGVKVNKLESQYL